MCKPLEFNVDKSNYTVVRERVGVEASLLVEITVGARAGVAGAPSSTSRERTDATVVRGGAAGAEASVVAGSGNGLGS